MRRTSLAVVLLSSGLVLSACGSSGGGGAAGAGGHAGSGSGGAGAGGRGGTTGTAGTGGSSGGSTGVAGAAGGAGVGGQAGTAGGGTGGASGASGGAGASGTGGRGGTGGNAGAAGGGSGGTGAAGAAGGASGTSGSAGAGGAAGSGTGGAAGGSGAGGNAGTVGSGGAAGAAGAGGGAGAGGSGGSALTVEQTRGQYLVTGVLGCTGCHTPTGGALLSGTDCFVKSGTTGCLSSANLTNDATGLKNLTDQQIKDAFTKGMNPATAGSYLFANMPYYQFANLNDADASAIVAYLRTVPAANHAVQASTAPFDVRPTTPEWAAVTPSDLPAASAAVGPTNGKYLATLACVTCHTVETTGATPRHLDATKAFQGGKIVTATVNGASKSVQTSNLTPDATGLMAWNATQVAAAITTDKDRSGTTICGMRALTNMTVSDATDIATYLLGMPAVANAITMTCQ